jgi:hypothetical protein
VCSAHGRPSASAVVRGRDRGALLGLLGGDLLGGEGRRLLGFGAAEWHLPDEQRQHGDGDGEQDVERHEDPRDRRVRRAELTEAGATMVHRLITDTEERQQDLLRRLDLPSLEVVAKAYELMVGAAAVDAPAPPAAAPAEPAV